MHIDLFRTVPVLITCRDRLESLMALVDWLEAAGHEWIVFVDNDSSYPALLEYYKSTPHVVLRLGENLGHHAVWQAGVLERIGHRGLYVVTDPDVLPDEACPFDAVNRFAELLLHYSDVDKVGFGLKIDDLPEQYGFRAEVIDWESQFWEAPVEDGVYLADIDTTFALYRPSVVTPTFRALRTGPPYVARHLPWYSDTENPNEEESYYRKHAAPDTTNWDTDVLSPATQQLVAQRRQQVTERALLLQAEAELAAIKATRSYRWLAPVRRLRSSCLRRFDGT